jgi:hypothetical protein
MIFCLVLAGCNLPARTTPEVEAPELIYTAAAQTVVARVTEDASVQPTSMDSPSATIAQPPVATWTPEPTFTETPTLTSTATQTHTPIPDAILEDDFSNTSLWYVDQEDQYGFEYQNGSYRIYNQIVNGTIWSIRGSDYKDIQVEVDALRQDGPEEGYFGVLCRLTNDGEDYYALVVGDNGFYGILKMLDGESDFLETGMDEAGIIQRGLGKVNRVRGVCSGSRLVLYANGQELLTVEDDSLVRGDVGLVVGNPLSGSGIDVLFDNFALIRP